MWFIRELAYHQIGRVPLTQHRHSDGDSVELIQVLDGGGNALIGDKTYPLLPGTLLFIDAAGIHALNPQDDTRYCRNKLIIGKSALFRALETVGGETVLHAFTDHGGSCFTPTPELADEIDQVFRLIHQHSSADNSMALWAVLQLIQLAGHYADAAPPETDPRISAILQYIHAHYAEALTVERIAAETHLSKYYLCHLFHAHTGITVMQYLNEQRLISARRLLTQTSRPIAEIAQDCGFGSSSHFCTVFRAREGISPREFRNKNSSMHT